MAETMTADIASTTLAAAALLRSLQESSGRDRESCRIEVSELSASVDERLAKSQTEIATSLKLLGAVVSSNEARLSELLDGACQHDAGMVDRESTLRHHIQALRAGDTLRVRAGVFQGPFVIPEGVRVVTSGGDEVIFDYRATTPGVACVTMERNAQLHGVTIRQRGADGPGVRVVETPAGAASLGIASKLVGCHVSAKNCPALLVERGVAIEADDSTFEIVTRGATAVQGGPDATVTLSCCSINSGVDGATSPGSAAKTPHAAVSTGVATAGCILESINTTVRGFGIGIRVAGRSARPCTITGGCISASELAALQSDASCSGLMVSGVHIDGSSAMGASLSGCGAGLWLRDLRCEGCAKSGVVLQADVDLSKTALDGVRITNSGQVGLLLLCANEDAATAAEWLREQVPALQLDGNALGPWRVDSV